MLEVLKRHNEKKKSTPTRTAVRHDRRRSRRNAFHIDRKAFLWFIIGVVSIGIISLNYIYVINSNSAQTIYAYAPVVNNLFARQCFEWDASYAETAAQSIAENSLTNATVDAVLTMLQYSDASLMNLLRSNTLAIFVTGSAERAPTTTEGKCGISIHNIITTKNYYFFPPFERKQKSFFEKRDTINICLNVSLPKALKQESKMITLSDSSFNHYCQRFDQYRIYQWIRDTLNSTDYKWALVLEDDVSFCPYLFDYIEKLITTKSKLINFVTLSGGQWGVLIRVDFIPTLLQIMHPSKTVYSDYAHVDIALTRMANMTNEFKRYGIYWTKYTMVYHPSTLKVVSSMKHQYSADTKCYTLKIKRWLMSQDIPFIDPFTPSLQYQMNGPNTQQKNKAS